MLSTASTGRATGHRQAGRGASVLEGVGVSPSSAPGSGAGRAAEACAAHAGYDEPDYTVDRLGWRPAPQPMDGPAMPGLGAVMQAQSNLLLHLDELPDARSLRVVIDSHASSPTKPRLESVMLNPNSQRSGPPASRPTSSAYRKPATSAASSANQRSRLNRIPGCLETRKRPARRDSDQ